MSDLVTPRSRANSTGHIQAFTSVSSDLLKRLFDFIAAAFGLILLSPVFILLAWRIKRDSPGPVFYHGPRVGRGGRAFYILKFRTMYDRPESYQGLRVTAQDDERITPFGKFLRNTKLNELPQLWNVLVGEMSLVGPRPEDPDVAAKWPLVVRQDVLSVRPGITSPASVLYRDEETLLAGDQVMHTYLDHILPSKLRLDQLYVRHHSLSGDLDIIFWTLLVLFPRIGMHSPPEDFLILGPLARLVRRHLSWFLVDALVTFVAMGLTGLVWRSFVPLHIGWGPALALALGFAILKSLIGAAIGANRIEWARASSTDLFDLAPGLVIATGIALLLNYFWPAGLLGISGLGAVTALGTRPLLPNGLILMTSGLAFGGYVLVRYRSRLITGLATRWLAWRGAASTALERVMIIGGGESGQFAAWVIGNNRKYAQTFHVVGFVDDDLYMQGVRLHGLNHLGKRADISRLVDEHDVGILVFAIHNISPAERQELLDICSGTLARVVFFPDIPAALSGLAQRAPGRNGGSGNGHKPNGAAGVGAGDLDESTKPRSQPLPCELCLTKVFPLKVETWIGQLEAAAAAGDVVTLQAHLRAMRGELHGDPLTSIKN